MIEKLEQLTVAQFVCVVCGDTSVLTGGDKTASDTDIAAAVRNIIFEYREIADPSGLKSYLLDTERLVKAKILVEIFSICANLAAFNEYGRIREVLSECGIRAEAMTDQRVVAEVKSRLGRAKRDVAEIESGKEETPEVSIRREFDEQTAALIAYFKFQIDTETMKAPIYAHLVARYIRDINAQKAALKK